MTVLGGYFVIVCQCRACEGECVSSNLWVTPLKCLTILRYYPGDIRHCHVNRTTVTGPMTFFGISCVIICQRRACERENENKANRNAKGKAHFPWKAKNKTRLKHDLICRRIKLLLIAYVTGLFMARVPVLAPHWEYCLKQTMELSWNTAYMWTWSVCASLSEKHQ